MLTFKCFFVLYFLSWLFVKISFLHDRFASCCFQSSLNALVTLYYKSNFYALIGQNLTGEFMRKIHAASWNLFTVTAEADRVLCQLVMFLTGCRKWNSAAIKSLLLFMASLFIGFLVEKYGIDSFSFFALLNWKVWSDCAHTW